MVMVGFMKFTSNSMLPQPCRRGMLRSKAWVRREEAENIRSERNVNAITK